jgi:cobalt-zinc-cadmium efflux system protein
MSHDHHHHHHHGAGEAGLRLAFLINLAFTVIEIAGGIWTNSVAIQSDAVHDAGDCLTLGLAWALQRWAAREPDVKFNYGYRRLSTLGALVTATVLIVGLSYVGWEAIERLRRPAEVHSLGVCALALLGILFNGAAAWRLRGSTSLNVKLASWHLLEDTLGWGAVLVGGVVMSLWNLPLVDPILSLLISLLVLWNVFRNLARVGLVFLQAAPVGFDRDEFERQLADLPGVVSSHHTHTWSLDGDTHVFTTHLVMEAGTPREQLVATKRRVHQLLREHDFEHITVEVELEGEACAGVDNF